MVSTVGLQEEGYAFEPSVLEKNRGHLIRHTPLMLGWFCFFFHSYLNYSWHSINQMLQISQLDIHDVNLLLHQIPGATGDLVYYYYYYYLKQVNLFFYTRII